MKIFKNICILIWRIWFISWIFISVLLLLPFLAVVFTREKWLKIYFKIARIWAKLLLFIGGFRVDIERDQLLDPGKSFLFCPNHSSMIDIMLLLAITKNPFVFVGKKELSRLPFFGYIYKRTTIMVDRSDSQSKIAVYKAAENSIGQNLSLCMFPEGKVPDDESIILDDFQNGVFRLAIENNLSIVPISFFDCKKRHSYTFFSGGPGKLRVKIHQLIPIDDPAYENRNQLKNKTFQIIYESLMADKSYMKSSI